MTSSLYNKKYTLNLNGRIFDLSTPKVMGIINVTPDSFYDGGRYVDDQVLREHIDAMVSEGVDIFDVGASSSRPGADEVSQDEEIARLLPVLQLLRERHADIPISVDTFRSAVAKKVIEDFQVEIINDISAGELDADMFDVVAEAKVTYVMMHMRGTPQTMSKLTDYDSLMAEMLLYFSRKINILKAKGVKDIIIDPGFGFAKTLERNYQLLSQLHVLEALEVPVLVGASRKSMIYKLLDTTPQASLNGSSVVHTFALQRGANILRVHDVKAAKEVVSICDYLAKL